MEVTNRLRLVAILAALVATLAAPAAARATVDLAISQTASSHIVKPGDVVTLTVTVTNQGTGPQDGFVDIDSMRAHGQPANNPYQSSSASQGSCVDQSSTGYHFLVCTLGSIAPGASVQIVGTVKVNDTAGHGATLLPNDYEGGYNDDDNSNNAAYDRITVSRPPTVTGSKQIKLQGLPEGCVPGDFTLKISTHVAGVKKIVASMFLGFDQSGDGIDWQRSGGGSHLRVKVPASRILDPVLGQQFKLTIKVKRHGGGGLKRIVLFELC